MQRIHVIYSGQVQGVGFRFTTERIAVRLGITGFVKNLPDGNVEIICEGDDPSLETFLSEIQGEMDSYISSSKTEREPPVGEFTSFDIRF